MSYSASGIPITPHSSVTVLNLIPSITSHYSFEADRQGHFLTPPILVHHPTTGTMWPREPEAIFDVLLLKGY